MVNLLVWLDPAFPLANVELWAREVVGGSYIYYKHGTFIQPGWQGSEIPIELQPYAYPEGFLGTNPMVAYFAKFPQQTIGGVTYEEVETSTFQQYPTEDQEKFITLIPVTNGSNGDNGEVAELPLVPLLIGGVIVAFVVGSKS